VYGLDGLQKGCGTEMGPKACDDEMDLPDGRETYGDLRIIRMVVRKRPLTTMSSNYRGYEESPNYGIGSYARPSSTT
jgi:hypothetical protein